MASVARLSSVSSAVWAGFRSGGLASFAVRPSSRSSSGWVAVLSFRAPAAAGRFAAAAARRAGVSVVVRRVGAFRSVSVPVSPVWLPSGLFVGSVGGVRGVAASLRSFSGAAALS